MTRLTRQRLLIAAVVVANCAPWLIYRWLGSPYEGPGWGDEIPRHLWTRLAWRDFLPLADYLHVFHALTVAQVLLFSIWAAFGRKTLLWRWAYLLVVVMLLIRMHLTDLDANQAEWIAAKRQFLSDLMSHALVVGGCLLLMRLAGFQLYAADSGDQPRPITLRYLLWSVLAACLLLAQLRRLITPEDMMEIYWHLRYETYRYLTVTAMTGACVWLALGRRLWPLRLGVLASVVALAGCWAWTLTGPILYRPRLSWDAITESVAFYGPVALWIVGTLWAFRLGGYCLGWQDPIPRLRSNRRRPLQVVQLHARANRDLH